MTALQFHMHMMKILFGSPIKQVNKRRFKGRCIDVENFDPVRVCQKKLTA